MYSFSCFTFHVLIVEFIRLFIHADPMFLDRYVQSFINRSKNGKISTPHHNKKKKKKKKELQFENLKILLLPILWNNCDTKLDFLLNFI